MLQTITKPLKFATMFSCRHYFSFFSKDRKDIIPHYHGVILDIKEENLKNQISKQLNKQYVSPLSQDEKQVEQKRKGIIYGSQPRGMISLPTRYSNNKPIWIHYLVATGSPRTYLTQEAIRALTGPSDQAIRRLPITINGKQITVDKTIDNFIDVNILGMNYLVATKSLVYHLEGQTPQKYLEIQF